MDSDLFFMRTFRAHSESSRVYKAFKHVSMFWVHSDERVLHSASMQIPLKNYKEINFLFMKIASYLLNFFVVACSIQLTKYQMKSFYI